MANIMQTADGALDIAGKDLKSGGFVVASCEYTASTVDKVFSTMNRRMIVKAITGFVTVAGTGGAATATIRKVPSGTALASGTALHSGSFNFVGTAVTVQDLTLSTTLSDLILEDGDSLAIDCTGTLTSATGVISVHMAPA